MAYNGISFDSMKGHDLMAGEFLVGAGGEVYSVDEGQQWLRDSQWRLLEQSLWLGQQA